MLSRSGPEDGGMVSRKFLLTVLSLLILTGIAILAANYSAVATIFPTFVGGLLGVLSVYFTGNVVTKHVVGKNGLSLTPENKIVEEDGEA